jgi:hypothetical protein
MSEPLKTIYTTGLNNAAENGSIYQLNRILAS